MFGAKIIVAFYLLFPPVSVLIVRLFVNRGRSRSSGSSDHQETQPAKKIRRHPYWTHQRLRDHLDGEFLFAYKRFFRVLTLPTPSQTNTVAASDGLAAMPRKGAGDVAEVVMMVTDMPFAVSWR